MKLKIQESRTRKIHLPALRYCIQVNTKYTTPSFSIHGNHWKFVPGLMFLYMTAYSYFEPFPDGTDLI
jgi:hypothetical protein